MRRALSVSLFSASSACRQTLKGCEVVMACEQEEEGRKPLMGEWYSAEASSAA